MAEEPIEPPDESGQKSPSEIVFLRIGTTFLCALIAVGLVLLGYALALFLGLDWTDFDSNAIVFFSVALVIWILIGIFTPLDYFSKVFEFLKDTSPGRIAAVLLGIALFIALHWYLIGFITEAVVAIFGIE